MAPWLVTGANGFLGRHVLDRIGSQDHVFVLGRRPPHGWPLARFLKVDLSDPDVVNEAILNLSPAVVLHLAGKTPPARADQLYQTNVLGTLHLLDALRALKQSVRLILAGSAAELGPVEDADLPVGESYPPQPRDAYGLSKHLAAVAALAAQSPIEVIVARVFNPIGPGLPQSQAFGRFAHELARPGPDPLILQVGDLESKRDFVDVRDVASALVRFAQDGSPGLYHLGTGQSHSVRSGLDHLIACSGRVVKIALDPTLGASQGPRDSRADASRAAREIGWSPTYRWEQSLLDLWNEARLRLTEEGSTV